MSHGPYVQNRENFGRCCRTKGAVAIVLTLTLYSGFALLTYEASASELVAPVVWMTLALTVALRGREATS